MVSRLVLGCTPVAVDVAESAKHGHVKVVCGDERRVDTLRSENVDAIVADPNDPDVLRSHTAGDDVGLVFVAADGSDRNVAIASVARECFPDAVLVACTGEDAGDGVRETLESVADRVVDPVLAVASSVTDRASSPAAKRARRLRTALGSVDGRLAVVTHDNPDPDAIASAVALVRIAELLGVDAEACYFGDITHQQNRAFVNLLDLSLRHLEPDEDLSEFGGFALVDHSRAGVNDQLPEGLPVDVVVDHHPPRAPVDAAFADLRHDVGATSTLMTEYLTQFGVALERTLATALLYGIRIDTRDFTREVSRADFEAAAQLVPNADMGVLDRIEEPSIGGETLDILARAIENREVQDDVLASSVGRLSDRDALAQAADQLLQMEGINTTLVYGVKEGTVFVSARARATDLDLGETLRDAFGQIGSAGGHADMAGAQIPLGVITSLEADDEGDEEAIVHAVVTDRFFDAVRERPPEFGDFGFEDTDLVPTWNPE